jgi:hypothetical protein
MVFSVQLENKFAADQRFYLFEFLSELQVGVSLVSAGVTCLLWSGTDASPSSMVSGSATIDGTTVRQMIVGGVEGNIYTLVAAALTSDGQTVRVTGQLAIVPQRP